MKTFFSALGSMASGLSLEFLVIADVPQVALETCRTYGFEFADVDLKPTRPGAASGMALTDEGEPQFFTNGASLQLVNSDRYLDSIDQRLNEFRQELIGAIQLLSVRLQPNELILFTITPNTFLHNMMGDGPVTAEGIESVGVQLDAFIQRSVFVGLSAQGPLVVDDQKAELEVLDYDDIPADALSPLLACILKYPTCTIGSPVSDYL